VALTVSQTTSRFQGKQATVSNSDGNISLPESFYTQVFAAAANAIVIVSSSGVIESVNRAACELTGYSPKEMQGQPLSLLCGSYAQDDLGAWRALAAGEVWRAERLYRRKGGDAYFDGMEVTAVYAADGSIVRYVVIKQDITERKRTEAMLIEERALLAERIATHTAELSAAYDKLAHVAELQQAILDNAGRMIVATDAAGILRVFNPAAEHMLGYTAAEVLGKAAPVILEKIGEVIVVGLRMQADDESPSAINSLGYSAGAAQGLMQRKDGTRFPAVLSLTILRDRMGEFSGYVGVGSDITVVKQVEENLRRSEETLRVANAELARTLRIRDEFLASMSHELRTPLAAILSLSEGLSDEVAGPLNERQRKYVATITESGQHLLALINDVLDLSKIEAGRLQLELAPLDVDLVCHASMRMVREQAQQKGLTGSLHIEDAVSSVVADERRLKQILVNLLSNAVKFTPEGGAYGIDVRADYLAQQVSFCVWDTGIGIDPAFLPYLFQPFVQVDTRLARRQGGTGLGLALVRRMAELHGGFVEVKSTSGKGTRFVVTLPWQPDAHDDLGDGLPAGAGLDAGLLLPQAAASARPPGLSPTLAHSTILLVEDNESTSIAIQDYLSSRGCTVLKARGGIDALQIALAVRPDLILMDIQMPDMDGIETTRRLRTYPHMKSVVIIALTALAMREDRERCLAAGMNDYMAKPVEFRKLAQLIEQYLAPNRPA
jgi:PAS domain S-box-containing protein